MKKIMGLLFVISIGILLLSACSSNKTNSDFSIKNSMNTEEYAKKLIPKIKLVNDSLDELQSIANEVVSQPTLLLDNSYQQRVQDASDKFYIRIEDVKEMEVGDNPDVNKIHDLILKAMDDFEFVAMNFPEGTQNLDSELIEQSSLHMKSGARYFSQATIKVKEITKDY